MVRIPLKWDTDSGEVGQRRSEEDELAVKRKTKAMTIYQFVRAMALGLLRECFAAVPGSCNGSRC